MKIIFTSLIFLLVTSVFSSTKLVGDNEETLQLCEKNMSLDDCEAMYDEAFDDLVQETNNLANSHLIVAKVALLNFNYEKAMINLTTAFKIVEDDELKKSIAQEIVQLYESGATANESLVREAQGVLKN